MNDMELKDFLVTQLECLLGLVEVALSLLQGTVSATSDITTLTEYRAHAREYHRFLLASTATNSSCVPTAIDSVYICQTRRRGRPRIVVNVEEVGCKRGGG